MDTITFTARISCGKCGHCWTWREDWTPRTSAHFLEVGAIVWCPECDHTGQVALPGEAKDEHRVMWLRYQPECLTTDN